MADPTPLCALAYLSFVSFINHHGDPATYAQSYDFAMFIATEASDIADQLAPCEGRSAEVAQIISLGPPGGGAGACPGRPGPSAASLAV